MDHLIHVLYVRKLAPRCELGQHSSSEVDLCLAWGCLSVRWELLTMSSLSASDKSGCGLQAPSLSRSVSLTTEASNGREESVSRLLCGRSGEDLLTWFCKAEGTAPGGANRYPTCCRWAQMDLFGQHLLLGRAVVIGAYSLQFIPNFSTPENIFPATSHLYVSCLTLKSICLYIVEKKLASC